MDKKRFYIYRALCGTFLFTSLQQRYYVNLPPLFCRETFPHVDAVIRKGYAAEKNRAETAGSHAPKAPHVRRAHWHHYWTGARVSAERCLVLKWMPPVFVGGASADIVTIHPVKGGQP